MIYMVLEYGDIDLARLLAKQESARRTAAGAQPDENFIRLYWQQMLQVRGFGPRAGASAHVKVVPHRCRIPDGHSPLGHIGQEQHTAVRFIRCISPHQWPSICGDPLRCWPLPLEIREPMTGCLHADRRWTPSTRRASCTRT